MAEQLLQAVQILTAYCRRVTARRYRPTANSLRSGHSVVKLVAEKQHSVNRRQHRGLPVCTFGPDCFAVGWIICFVAFIGLMCLGGSANGEELSSGSSGRKHRQAVLEQIPYARLNEETKLKIGDVLNKPNMYRALPKMAIQIDPDYLQFLIRHPEVVVNIWELMGITEMKASRVGPYNLKTDDGAGTTSDMELVYGSGDMHIYYGEGQYEGPVLRKQLNAQCVIVVRTSPRNDQPAVPFQAAGNAIIPNDRQMICQLDVFLKIENAAAGLVVRTIQPIVGPTADHNFVESMKFIQRLNETTEENGYGVQAMGKKLDVEPRVREKFIAVAGDVYQRSLARAANANGSSYDLNLDRNVNRNVNQLSPVRPSPVGAQPLTQPRQVTDRYDVKQSSFSGAAGRWQSNVRPAYHYATPQWRSAPAHRFGPARDSHVQRAVFSDH